MTEGLRSITALSKESLRGIEPSTELGDFPVFEMVDPRELFVEEDYQRDLSENSISLIRRIVAGFAWDSFKPPVCVRRTDLDGILLCIDGQHTAISAASHPAIDRIPIMIVGAPTKAKRASAFVRHNRDRIALTQMAIFFAELHAGDEIAVAVDRACKAAGARILNKPINLKQKTAPGETIAVGTIRNIARKSGEAFLARVLKLLTDIGRGPLRADEIAGAAIVLERSEGLDRRLSLAIGMKSADQWGALAATAAAAGHARGPAGEVLATLWSREMGVRLAPKAKPEPKAVRRAEMPPAIKERLAAKKNPPSKVQVKAEKVQVAPAPRPIVRPAPARHVAPAPRPQAQKAPEAPRPQPARPSAPRPAPAPQPMAAAPPPPKSAIVQHAGLSIDTGLGSVRRPGCPSVEVGAPGARLVALLARVQPAFLEGADLMQKLGLDSFRLRSLVGAVNRDMQPVRLEIRNVMKTGWMLAILD